jgi:transcriptional regulator with XRE-family HTH domain
MGNERDKVEAMRRPPKLPAPPGFIKMLREGMDKQKISLNQLAEKARVSPAFLSRILNKERGLPSDKAILQLANVLDLQPPERLLIEAGRIPEELKPALSQSRIPELLRAAGKLSETEQEELLRTAKSLYLKQHGRQRK